MEVVEEKLTVEQYLELEKTSETRYEYVDGRRYKLTGEKRRHNKLVGRLVLLLSGMADKKGASLFVKA
jgi:Uma2 family endonuclease